MRYMNIFHAPDNDGGAPAGGQEPTTPPTTNSTTTPAQDAGRDWEAELAAVRKEAAKYRTERNELRTKIADIEPKAQKLIELENAQKSEVEKQAERLAAMQAELETAKATAAKAANESRFYRLAATAGVDLDHAALFDLSKFDLDDEAGTVERLKSFAKAPQLPSGGKPSAPAANGKANEPTEAELIEKYFRPAGRGIAKIFGG